VFIPHLANNEFDGKSMDEVLSFFISNRKRMKSGNRSRKK